MAELVGRNLASALVLRCCAVTSVIAACTKAAAQRAGCSDCYWRSESYSASDSRMSLSSEPK